jgi:hypothetical protein
MNVSRIVLGGLAAGVVCNVSGMLLGALFLVEEARAVFSAMASPPPPLLVFATHVSLRLAIGLLVAWLYAAIRPRFGPGPRTALIAALAVWLSSCVFGGILLLEVRIYSLRTTLIALAWGLVEMALVALTAGWIYREAPLPADRT